MIQPRATRDAAFVERDVERDSMFQHYWLTDCSYVSVYDDALHLESGIDELIHQELTIGLISADRVTVALSQPQQCLGVTRLRGESYM